MGDLELISYLRSFMQAVHGLDLSVDGAPERAVMAKLRRTYGTDGGQIVKWVLWRYSGLWEGAPVGYFSFASGRKWWTDKMHAELQRQRFDESRATGGAESGFATLEV